MPSVSLPGPAGRLEGRYSPSAAAAAPVALILHPHPLHGGSLNNRVVFSLDQAFRRRGFVTVRINFRGVGGSEGGFDEGEGELADAAAALDWLRAQRPGASGCWVAGFSFGAWVALRLLGARVDIDGFVVVAPPANLFDFSAVGRRSTPGLVVQGDQDDLVPEPAVAALVARLKASAGGDIDYQPVAGADHFFNEHGEPLAAVLDDYLERAPLAG